MRVSVKKTINAPSEILWNYLADYSNIERFHPLLSSSQFIEGADSCEIGSTRQCNMKDGNYVKERITDWVEGSHYTVDIYESSMPIKSAKGTLGVKAINKNSSEAFFTMEVTPKIKAMHPMMFLLFKFKVAPNILKGLHELYQREYATAV